MDGWVNFNSLLNIEFEEFSRSNTTLVPKHRNAISNEGELYGIDDQRRFVKSRNLIDSAQVLAEGPFGELFAINGDGDRAAFNYTTVRINNENILVGSPLPVLWQANEGTQVLPLPYTKASITAASRNFHSFAGWAPDENSLKSTNWALTPNGYRLLSPLSYSSVDPKVISDDGARVFGTEYWIPAPLHPTAWGGLLGVTWDTDNVEAPLLDANGVFLGPVLACDAQCDTTFGAGEAKNYRTYSFGGGLWVGDINGLKAWHKAPSDNNNGGQYSRLEPIGSSRDGHWVVGNYDRAIPYHINSPYHNGAFPFVWTEATGTQSLFSILVESDLTDSDWGGMEVIAVSENAEYILVSGFRLEASGENHTPLPEERRFARIRLRRR